MARDNYTDSITRTVTTSISSTQTITYLEPLANIQITVYKYLSTGTRDTTPSAIYTTRNGSTVKANPFVTSASGQVTFWADAGDYDILFHDLSSPARIGDQTLGWEALPAADQSIPMSLLPGAGQGLAVTGELKLFAGTSAPAGWLFADGRVLSRTTYAALYAVIGTAYNTSGESSTDFRIPDYRGRMIMGPDNFGTTGAASRITVASSGRGGSGGTERHALTIAEMPLHNHPPLANSNGFIVNAGSPGLPQNYAGAGAGSGSNYSVSATTANVGNGDAHSNMPPYQATPVIIKT